MKQYRKRVTTVEVLLLIAVIKNLITLEILNQIPNISNYLTNTYPNKNPNIIECLLNYSSALAMINLPISLFPLMKRDNENIAIEIFISDHLRVCKSLKMWHRC